MTDKEEEEVRFDSLPLDARLLRATSVEFGWTTPTLIQQAAIPLALEGRDIVARAKTGSGKTAAYGLPLLEKILSSESSGGIRALVLVPSKELAAQVTRELSRMACFCEDKQRLTGIFNACAATGALVRGENPCIVVATPTKFVQLVQTQSDISLVETLESLVIDEADLILSFGYQDDLEKIKEMLPKVYQSFLFSATMTTVCV